ncbi:MAG: arginine--tRNA ligase [Anaerolineaceae bacterium]|nr:arginine--tRNA ligase [Anaerolineaceae bacterium]
MFNHEKEIIEVKIFKILSDNGINISPIVWSWIPFSGHWGLATSFFKTASENSQFKTDLTIKKRAEEIADLVKGELELPKEFEKAEAIKGYLNLYLDPGIYARNIIKMIFDDAKCFGMGLSGKTIMVEYSQPNTHKAFHVGHLRNMVLGSSVCHILEHAGNKVIRTNYIGDIGLHVIKWLWNYLNYHQGQAPPAEGKTRWMGEIYVEAIRRLEENPDLEIQVRELFKRWDDRDPEIISLWQETRKWSLDAFTEVYKILDIHFDKIYFESEVEDSGKEIVQELIDKGIAKDERPEGAVVVDLDATLGTENQYRVAVILRSDGTSLYSTKDLSLAINKFKEYNPDQSVYVIDVRQSLYLKQIFKILELLGYQWATKCFHLAYEIVNLPGNVTIASRDGTVVLLEDLIAEAEKRALAVVEIKNPELDSDVKSVVARKIALGALKYSLLSRDNTKVITFDWNTAMDVNGQAAPYIQYAYVRANSILKKVHFSIPPEEELGYTLSEAEIELINMFSKFPQEVERAAKDMRPLLIANYAYELAKTFSNFYNTCPVLTAETDIRNFRLRLVASARQVIANSLGLLGIDVPDVM